jgi:23S rRNA (guanosine2251-2'-O)-methyltransferase
VPFINVTNLARTIRDLKDAGVWVVGAAGETETTIYQASFSGPIAIAMGAEGDGLRRLTKESCDSLVKIPMFGAVSSLNVSVATGICLYEAVRQRQK